MTDEKQLTDTDLKKLSETWDTFGEVDPMWAIYSEPEKLGRWWKEDEFFRTGEAEIARSIEQLRTIGASPPFDAVLDFGCGIGRLSRALAAYSDLVVGVDIAPSMIERARALHADFPKNKWVLNQSPDLSVFSDATFSLIYTNIVLQHMKPALARSYLKEFFRITKPQGWIVFQLPDASTLTLAQRARNLLQNEIVPRLPESVRQRLRRWRYPNADEQTLHNLPFAQMYGMAGNAVAKLVNELGGEICLREIEDNGDDGWKSVRYYVQRKGT